MFPIDLEHGALATWPGCTLVAGMALHRRSGCLVVTAAGVSRMLWFHEGRVIFAGSSKEGENVAGMLASRKVIDAATYSAIIHESRTRKLSPEVVLQQRGTVMGGQLRDATQSLARLMVRTVSPLADGDFDVQATTRPPLGVSLVDLDPLADMIAAAHSNLPDAAAHAWFAAHPEPVRARAATFARVTAHLATIGVRLPAAPPGVNAPLSTWIATLGAGPKGTLLAALLGAFESSSFAAEPAAARLPEPSSGSISVPPANAVDDEPGLSDEDRAFRAEIRATRARFDKATLFEVLGVKETAGIDEIKKAYFAVAQQWHVDRFAGHNIGPVKADLDAVFGRVNEAHTTLGDDKQRSNYLFVLDRQRKGLPTDVEVILRAEDLFRKAQMMQERGNLVGALPVLEEAIALNKGEPEFYVLHGFARFSAKGEPEYQAAVDEITEAIKMQPHLGVKANLYLAQIERLREKYDVAESHLVKVLASDPGNKAAERERQYINLMRNRKRDEAAAAAATKKGGLFGKLFNK